jgi:hypothetical protein
MTGRIDPASQEGISEITPIIAGLTGYGFMGAAPKAAMTHAVLGPRKHIFYDEDALNHDLINSKTGQKVGYINMQRQPDNSLHVGIVQGTQGGPWQEGFSGTKELLKSIKKTYPDATGIEGTRISGARAKSSMTGPAKMSFGEKRFDPEELAKNAGQAAELRKARSQYWENASRAAKSQCLRSRRCKEEAFEDSHASAAQPSWYQKDTGKLVLGTLHRRSP